MCTSPQSPQLLELDRFQFGEHSLSIQIFHRCRVYQTDHGDLICGLCSFMERFLFLFLNHPAPGAQLWVLPHLCLWATHISLLPRLPWSTQVCPGKGRVWRWHNCLGRRCPGGDSCVRKPAATCARAPALVGAFPSAWQQVWRQAREGQPWWGLFLAPGGRHEKASPGGGFS